MEDVLVTKVKSGLVTTKLCLTIKYILIPWGGSDLQNVIGDLQQLSYPVILY